MRKKSFRVSIELAEDDAVAIVFYCAVNDFQLDILPNKITQKYCRDTILIELGFVAVSFIDDRGYFMGNLLDDEDNQHYETYVDIARQIEEQVHKIYKKK